MALKDVTLGQFFPGTSFLHRLDPRTKILMVLLYITALFLGEPPLSYGILFLLLLQGVFSSKVPFKSIVKGLKPLVFILSFTAILNIFFTPGETLWFEYGGITVYQEGVVTAIFMVCRIMMLVVGTFLLTYTTSPMVLTDGLESLMKPLNKLKVPVHELSMMMSIALRFIPHLMEEADKIMSAQKARGADFETGSFTKRAKALLPILVPMFISALRRADELADAMDCRCYHGGEGRTKMSPLKYSLRDYVTLVYVIVVVIVVANTGLIASLLPLP